MTIIRYMVPEISTATDRFFFSSLAIFCPFTWPLPPTPCGPKNKNLKKNRKKTPGDFTILHKCTKNDDHRLYCS